MQHPLSESVGRPQFPHMADRPLVVESFAKSNPAVEKGKAQGISAARHASWH